MNRHALFPALAALLAAQTACESPEPLVVPTTEPKSDAGRSQLAVAPRPKLLNDWLDDVATAEPAFAGMYYDSAGRFTVAVTNTARSSQALSLLSATFLEESGIGRGARSPIRATRVAKYSFAQLRTWYRYLAGVRAHPTMVGPGIDHMGNRIVIEISNSAARQDVEGSARTAGLREDAFQVVIGGIQPSTTINERYRPLRGGLQIGRRIESSQVPGFFGDLRCTMGPLVKVNAIPGFLTNSHCTSSNRLVIRKDVVVELREPFRSVASCMKSTNGDPHRDIPRTLDAVFYRLHDWVTEQIRNENAVTLPSYLAE